MASNSLSHQLSMQLRRPAGQGLGKPGFSNPLPYPCAQLVQDSTDVEEVGS